MATDYKDYLAEGMAAGCRYRLVPPVSNPQGLSGERMGNRPGSSLEFMDHREYKPGDDIRRIDWAAYGRSDKLIVRLYREEIDPHLEIILDGSVSMDLPGSNKSGAAVALAAMLAQCAYNAGFSYRLWMAGMQCRQISECSELPTDWHNIKFDFQGSPADSLTKPAGRMRPRAMRVFISDLMYPGDPDATMLALSENASSVLVVQMLAESDINPPGPGNIKLHDCETGELMEIYIDSITRKKYLDRLENHKQQWLRATRHCGAEITTLAADEFLKNKEIPDFILRGILR